MLSSTSLIVLVTLLSPALTLVCEQKSSAIACKVEKIEQRQIIPRK